jgi:PAS domain S-box-containing protein
MPTDVPPQSLKEAEYRHRQIVNSTRHFGIISTDLRGVIQSWNTGASEILGWTEEDMLGERLHRIFTKEDLARNWAEVEMGCALEQGYARDERWHVRKNGERFWAVGELTPLIAPDGEAIGFVKILSDRTAQKQADASLKRLNEELEHLVAERTRERDRIWRNSLDLLLVISADGILRAINPAWTSLLGYAPEELVDHHFKPFIHPDDIGATTDAIARASTGPLVNFEVRIRHKQGHYLWFAWTAAPEEDFIYANGRDITAEKRQAEHELMRNEARLRLALEAGQMGAWEWNLVTDEVILLQGADLLHGFAPSDEPIVFPAMAAYIERVHPDDRPQLRAVVERALAEGGEHRVEYRLLWEDGSAHWVEARGTVSTDETGKPVHMTGVSINIARRKRSEEDLKFLAQASAELASLVDPLSSLNKLAALAVPAFADWCMIDMLRDDGALERVAVAHAEPQMVQLARDLHRRFPSDEKYAKASWDVIRSGEAAMVSEITGDMLEQSIDDKAYLAAIRRLGPRSYIAAPLAAHGKVMGVVSFIVTESHRIYAEEDLAFAIELANRAAVAVENAELYRAMQEADRSKDVFLATLAHELRNPLAAITNGVSILKLAADNPERVMTSTGIMERQVSQLARLVDDLLDISRITTGKIELRKEHTSLAGILNNAIEISRPLIEAAQHRLSLTLPGEATDLHADPVRLTQVFANLLNNAAKYTDPGGRIEIMLECTPDEYLVRIRDNGIGIAPSMLKSIFHIFTQAPHPSERTHGGLGIGLSLVEGLLKLHGGRVHAFSQGEGSGSEFTVCLPRDAAGAPEQDSAGDTAAGQQQERLSRRRVLVVDDNIDAAVTIAEIVGMLGSDVTVVHDGLAAVAKADEEKPDLVLLDIGLPGIDGYEAARRMRLLEGGGDMMLVAITGWGQERDRRRAVQAGFDEHWVKPVSLDQLKRILNT